jgi:DNA-binding MarR family transcriptional regulator
MVVLSPAVLTIAREPGRIVKTAHISLDTLEGDSLLFRIRKDSAVKSFEDCVVFLLAKAYQKAHGNLKKRLHPYGLTPIQYLIVESLLEEDGLTAGDIGKRLVLDNATLSGVLDRLSERDWIEKHTDPKDKRLLRIYLTDKAKALQGELGEEREQANEEILHSLSMEEKVLLKRLLRDVRA